MKNWPILFIGWIVIDLMLFTGCGSKYPKDLPKIYPTSATVKYESGKPVANASVAFVNMDSSLSRWICIGTTDANGTVNLRTQGNFDGIPAGDYKVLITSVLSEGIPYPGEPTSEETEKLYHEWKNNKEKRFSLIDIIYEDRETTPLTVKVEKKRNQFQFNVGKELKIPLPTMNP